MRRALRSLTLSISLAAALPLALADDPPAALLEGGLELAGACPNSPAALAPDRRRVAYVHADAGAYTLEVATLEEDGALTTRTLAPLAAPSLELVSLSPTAWSADGRYLAYADVRAGLPTAGYVDVASGDRTTLGGPGKPAIAPSFAPAGDAIVWIEFEPSDAPRGYVYRRALGSNHETRLDLATLWTTLVGVEGKRAPQDVWPIPLDVRFLSDGSLVTLGQLIPTGGYALFVTTPDGASTRHVPLEITHLTNAAGEPGPPSLLAAGSTELVIVCDPMRPAPGGVRVITLDPRQDPTPQGGPEGAYHEVLALFGAQHASAYDPAQGSLIVDLVSGDVTPLGHHRVLIDRRGDRTLIRDRQTGTVFLR